MKQNGVDLTLLRVQRRLDKLFSVTMVTSTALLKTPTTGAPPAAYQGHHLRG